MKSYTYAENSLFVGCLVFHNFRQFQNHLFDFRKLIFLFTQLICQFIKLFLHISHNILWIRVNWSLGRMIFRDVECLDWKIREDFIQLSFGLVTQIRYFFHETNIFQRFLFDVFKCLLIQWKINAPSLFLSVPIFVGKQIFPFQSI